MHCLPSLDANHNCRLPLFGFTAQRLVMACLAKDPEGRPQSMDAIRDWIQSEGKAEGAIPKPSTKTIKMRAPAAAGLARRLI